MEGVLSLGTGVREAESDIFLGISMGWSTGGAAHSVAAREGDAVLAATTEDLQTSAVGAEGATEDVNAVGGAILGEGAGVTLGEGAGATLGEGAGAILGEAAGAGVGEAAGAGVEGGAGGGAATGSAAGGATGAAAVAAGAGAAAAS